MIEIFRAMEMILTDSSNPHFQQLFFVKHLMTFFVAFISVSLALRHSSLELQIAKLFQYFSSSMSSQLSLYYQCVMVKDKTDYKSRSKNLQVSKKEKNLSKTIINIPSPEKHINEK